MKTSLQGTVLAICLGMFVAQISAFPNTVMKARAIGPSTTEMTEAEKYADLVASFNWKQLLEHIPDFLFPVLEKILKGIARSKKPEEIIEAILTGKFKKSNKRRRKKKKEKKNKKEEETEKPENPEGEKPKETETPEEE